MPEPRRYGQWAGNERGMAEDPTRCAEEVADPPRYILFHQCLRKRGHGKDGLYCKQHAKFHPKEGGDDASPS